ncbi:DNA/RNA non-specific endonuclease [Fulvivirgaceae bacterium BMA12]|uniref:DNA/RNA non-specific endonuclease n=1 Tax=Agaribacillus aureus TaxID=3051825 RepID=A0ABT8L694_9BACT|nr:DNA/RNA non-specific endonuclease [Fulvivirgaceae bacterium BMA12]
MSNGFTTGFIDGHAINMPTIDGTSIYEKIDHTHMTINFNIYRKLPLYVACNYNKAKFIAKDKSGKAIKRGFFKADSNLDESLQLGEGFYKSETNDHETMENQNSFDRGHILSRRYTQWGDSPEEAKQNANKTFYFTNIAPQTRELNQYEWEELEAFVIEHGKLKVDRVSIFSGIFFNEKDPIATYKEYKTNKVLNFQIPIAFWKIVYYQVKNELRKIAFAMSQKSRMKELDFVQFYEEDTVRVAVDPFEKIDKELKPFIINSSLIEKITGLKFTPAHELFQEETPVEIIFERIETDKLDESDKTRGPKDPKYVIVNSSIVEFI